MLGYWITLFVLMFCGTTVFLNYIFFITMSVPAVGAFQREPKIQWRSFSVLTVATACGFLMVQFLREGVSGLVFHHASDPFGWMIPHVNFTSFLAVSVIFLPLSFACAMNRLIMIRKRKNELPF